MNLLNYVNGVFASAQSSRTFDKISSFDGSVLAQVADSDAMDVVMALQSTKKAQGLFAKSTLAERAQLLGRIASVLSKRAQEFAALEALYQGLPQNFVLEHGIHPAIEAFNRHVQYLEAESQIDSVSSKTQYSPSGVVGLITSWNLSLRLISERLAPALAAGNAVVVKVSPQSPISAKILGEVLSEAEAPAGLVNVLQGRAEVGQVLAGHPSLRAIAMVGRLGAAEAVVKTAIGQFKKIQVASGVKNSALVLSDVDINKSMPEILKSFLLGQGQMGWNTSRLFVLESMQSDFMESLMTAMNSLRPLESPQGDSDWTPLISREAVTSIAERVDFGKSEHGKIIWGGEPVAGPGFFYKPAIMLDLPNCSILQQDELHGPLLLITPVKYQHEMAKWVNTSYLSQSAYIWGSLDKASKVASQLDLAEVCLNSWPGQGSLFGHKQSFFGNPDTRWNGSFYSDVKNLTGFF